MTTNTAIHVQGLEKSYGELEVLRGVDFDVARGTIFALLGSNGAGKTTMVRILSTLLQGRRAGPPPSTASTSPPQPAQVRESISLTGQFAAVDEILTGRENLVLVAQLRHLDGPGRDRGRAARAVLPDRRGGAAGVDVLGGHAPASRHRDEPDRRPAGDLPRRADDRARPAVAPRGVADRPGARRPGHDGAAHHPVPRRGRAARRPDRDPPRGPDHRRTAPSPSSSGSSRPPRSSTSRSSRPWRTSSSRSSATTTRTDSPHDLRGARR